MTDESAEPRLPVCPRCGVAAPSAGETFCRACGLPLAHGPDVAGTTPPYVDAVSAPAPLPPSPEYAGFGIRAGARIVDLLIIYALAFVATVAGAFVFGLIAAAQDKPTAPIIEAMGGRGLFSLSFVMALAASFAFHAIADVIHGSTPGKMILGVVVQSEDGGPCTVRGAVVRELGYFVDGLFFGLIAYQQMKDSPERQRLGDGWGHTVVVRRASVPPARRRSAGRFALATVVACVSYVALVLALPVSDASRTIRSLEPGAAAAAAPAAAAVSDGVEADSVPVQGWETLRGEGCGVALPRSWFGGDPDRDTEALARRVERLGSGFSGLAGWVEDVASEARLIAVDSRVGGGRWASLAVYSEEVDPGLALEEYVAELAGRYAAAEGYEVAEAAIVDLEGRQAGRLVLRQPAYRVVDVAYAVLEGDSAYFLMYTTQLGREGALLSEFEASAGTFAPTPDLSSSTKE